MKGLVDAESPADFDLRLSKLESKWDDLEVSAHPQRGPHVYEWILTNEADVMKASMITPVHESAGLGSPPIVYTTY